MSLRPKSAIDPAPVPSACGNMHRAASWRDGAVYAGMLDNRPKVDMNEECCSQSIVASIRNRPGRTHEETGRIGIWHELGAANLSPACGLFGHRDSSSDRITVVVGDNDK